MVVWLLVERKMVIIILTRRGDDLKGAVPFFLKFPLDEDDEVGEK